MPREPVTHEVHRQNACILCWDKGDRPLPTFDSKSEEKPQILKFIDDELIPSFSEIHHLLPGSICMKCQRILSDKIRLKERATRKLPKCREDYIELVAQITSLPENSKEDTFCDCVICNEKSCGEIVALEYFV